jgi:integrase
VSNKTRRNNGEGTAPYETKDGRWSSEIVTGWVLRDGKKRPTRKVVYGSTKKECQANLRAALRNAEEGTLVAGKMPTVEEWMCHWLDNICAPKVRPSTLDAYRSTVKTWVIPVLGRKKLDKVTAEDLDLVYGNMRRADRADSMILKTHRIISRAFRVAIQRGRLGSNPCRLIDAPGSHREEIQALTVDQSRAILKVAQNLDDPLTIWEPGRGRPPVRLRNATRWTVALALG